MEVTAEKKAYYLTRLEGVLKFRKKSLSERDEEREREKQDRYGSNYVDQHRADIEALEWAISVLKEEA